jgi:hypothetical protein
MEEHATWAQHVQEQLVERVVLAPACRYFEIYLDVGGFNTEDRNHA